MGFVCSFRVPHQFVELDTVLREKSTMNDHDLLVNDVAQWKGMKDFCEERKCLGVELSQHLFTKFMISSLEHNIDGTWNKPSRTVC